MYHITHRPSNNKLVIIQTSSIWEVFIHASNRCYLTALYCSNICTTKDKYGEEDGRMIHGIDILHPISS